MANRKRKNTQGSSTNITSRHGPTKTTKKNETKLIQKNTEDEKPWSKSKKKRMRKLLVQRDTNNDSHGTNVRPGSNNTATQHSKNSRSKKKRATVARVSDDLTTESKDDENEVVPSTDNARRQPAPVSDGVNEDVVLMTGSMNRPKSALQQAFLARLAGSRFRELNEELYTTTSSTAHQRFQDNPELFDQYHQGFRTQVKSWPINPVDVILRWLIALQKKRAGGTAKGRGANKKTPSQRRRLTVADFGCGDAMLAQKLLDHQTKRTGGRNNPDAGGATKKDVADDTADDGSLFRVHSFDLVSNGNSLITPCDMANVPLDDGAADVGVFSLALMGTNIADFIREAHRVLTSDGVLKIAEVRSRFETTVHATAADGAEEGDDSDSDGDGGSTRKNSKRRTFDQTLLKEFLCVMRDLGFYCKDTDRSNTMFFLLEFKKTGAAPCKKATFTAKPCLYKRR